MVIIVGVVVLTSFWSHLQILGVNIDAEFLVMPIIPAPQSHGTSICLNYAFCEHVLGYFLDIIQILRDSVLNNKVK